VAAGIAILLEAGGLVTNANPPEDPRTAEVTDARLGSRLYLAIRLVVSVRSQGHSDADIALDQQFHRRLKLPVNHKRELFVRCGRELENWTTLDLVHDGRV